MTHALQFLLTIHSFLPITSCHSALSKQIVHIRYRSLTLSHHLGRNPVQADCCLSRMFWSRWMMSLFWNLILSPSVCLNWMNTAGTKTAPRTISNEVPAAPAVTAPPVSAAIEPATLDATLPSEPIDLPPPPPPAVSPPSEPLASQPAPASTTMAVASVEQDNAVRLNFVQLA